MAFQRKKPAAIGVKAPYPAFIEPELATSVEKVPSGARWLHEIKFDGYRVPGPSQRRCGQGLHPA
jgi:bifunctional non-homologous end joining protein LigD